MNTATYRTLGATIAFLAVVGCGTQPSAPRNALAIGGQVEASKAVLAKRLIVGFKALPDAAAIAKIEKATGSKFVRTISKVAIAVVETTNTKATRAALLKATGVMFVEGELLPELEPVKQTAVAAPRPTQGGSRVDPLVKDQWHLDAMNIPKVWAAVPNLKSVTVAVVDTGVDLKHPDLIDALVPGWNAGNPGQPPQDDAGHGTMTAGCVGAVANNAIGVAGVAPNAKIMPIKVGNSASSVVDAMIYAADHADMITMSLSFKPGMSEYPAAIESTKRAAAYVMSKNIPMACSMGNTGSMQRNVPAAFAGDEVPNLIAIGATGKGDKVSSFTTTGKWMSACAPGEKIMTTKNGGGYAAVDGTSFSTPITAGVMAMMLGNGAPKDPAIIKARLTKTAVDLEAAGHDERSGAGRVDAFGAVMAQ